MIGYISILLWKKITPVWFFMPSYFMIPVITVILIFLLVQSFDKQVIVALVGIAFGQLIYGLIIISYRLHNVIGEHSFFIHLSLTVLFLIFIQFIQQSILKISAVLRKI